MTPEDLAWLHRAGFAEGRPWTAEEFQDLLRSPAVFFVAGEDRAFALGRAMGEEAELLTLVTHPTRRRQGLARACLSGFEAEALDRASHTVFLEVAADNEAARHLYETAGYRGVGVRPRYYPRPNGAADALVLSKALTPLPVR